MIPETADDVQLKITLLDTFSRIRGKANRFLCKKI